MEQPVLDTHDDIDSFMETRIGYGPGQEKLIRSLYVLLFSQGCQTIVLGLLIPKLGAQWSLTTFDKSLLITMVYLGVSIGSYLQTFSDKYGRYKFLFIDAIITSVFGFLSCICPSFSLFVVVRFFYGIGIGIALPLTATYITQVVPGSHRARILSLSRVYWSMGCLFTIFAGWILFKQNHWRILLFLLCFPSFYAIYDIWQNGRQSLRYLWAKGDLETSRQVINMIADLNNKRRVTQQQLLDLMNKEKRQIKQQQQHAGNFMMLFIEKYFKQTLILVLSWTSVCFLYYAVMLILPSILNRNQTFSNSFQYFFLIIISIVECFSVFASKIVMDHPDFGRKRSLYLGFGIMFILSVIIVTFGQQYRLLLLLVFIGFKIFASICFMILYPYSAQIYETFLRSEALGIFSLCGRIATTFLGIVGISALEWANGKGLYLIFLFLTFFTTISLYKMPYCTLGRKLDS